MYDKAFALNPTSAEVTLLQGQIALVNKEYAVAQHWYDLFIKYFVCYILPVITCICQIFLYGLLVFFRKKERRTNKLLKYFIL